jgi:hypothetical protein
MAEHRYSSRILDTLASYGGEWSALCPVRFISWEGASGNLSIGRWVGPSAGVDAAFQRVTHRYTN